MIYFLLILFFGSLFGITFMIGRRLAKIQSGHVFTYREKALYEVEHFEVLKNITVQSIKYISYRGLVETIRVYVKTTNFLKKQYQNIENKLKERHERRLSKNGTEKAEPSKFLKMVSESKQKIRKIKRQIKREEENQ